MNSTLGLGAMAMGIFEHEQDDKVNKGYTQESRGESLHDPFSPLIPQQGFSARANVVGNLITLKNGCGHCNPAGTCAAPDLTP